MEFGIEKYSFMLILCAYQAFKVIKKRSEYSKYINKHWLYNSYCNIF